MIGATRPGTTIPRYGGYTGTVVLRDEPPDRARAAQQVQVGAGGMSGDRLQDQRAAPSAVGQQPAPEIRPLPRSPDGAPGTPDRREVQEHDGVRGPQPDVEDVMRPKIPV